MRRVASFTCGMSWEISLSRPSHRHCRHRCERPLRMDAPSTGWVTALAGLLARGSLPCWSGLPSFPVADLDLRLAAHSCGGSHGLLHIQKLLMRSNEKSPCSLFRPRSDSGNQHG